jgi:hypothetical protein
VGILFAVVKLLLKGFGFLFVGKGECGQAVLELEGVEEDAILVVGEGVVYLLVPDNTTASRRYVDQFQPERVAHQVICQHCRALQPGVGPSVPVRVGNVQFCDGNSVDLVGRLGHSALHRLLVLVGENRRHCGVCHELELRMVWNEPSGVDVLGSVGVRVSSGDEAAHVGAAVTIDCDVEADGRVGEGRRQSVGEWLLRLQPTRPSGTKTATAKT